MSVVGIDVSPELLDHFLHLGDGRHVVGVITVQDGNRQAVRLLVDAPDAPEGAVRMVPVWLLRDDGSVETVQPGWRGVDGFSFGAAGCASTAE